MLELYKYSEKISYEHELNIRFHFREPNQDGFWKEEWCSPSTGGERNGVKSRGHIYSALSTGAQMGTGGGRIYNLRDSPWSWCP